MLEMLYLIGKTLGLIAMGPVVGLSLIELVEDEGPIYTALTQRKAGIIFGGLVLLSFTWVYAYLLDLFMAIQ